MSIKIDENQAGDQASNLSKLWNEKRKEIIAEKNQQIKDDIANKVTQLNNQISSFDNKNKKELKANENAIKRLQTQVDGLSDDINDKSELRKHINKIIKKMNAKEDEDVWKAEGEEGNKVWYWYHNGVNKGAVKGNRSKEKYNG